MGITLDPDEKADAFAALSLFCYKVVAGQPQYQAYWTDFETDVRCDIGLL